MTNPFVIDTTAVQPAAAVLHVAVSPGGLEICGSAVSQAREGLSVGAVRRQQGTQGAALPAVAAMPDAHGHGPGAHPRGDCLCLVQTDALATDGWRAVLPEVRDVALPHDEPRAFQVF